MTQTRRRPRPAPGPARRSPTPPLSATRAAPRAAQPRVFTRVEWVGSWPVRSYVEGRLALQALPMLRSSDIWHRPVDPELHGLRADLPLLPRRRRRRPGEGELTSCRRRRIADAAGRASRPSRIAPESPGRVVENNPDGAMVAESEKTWAGWRRPAMVLQGIKDVVEGSAARDAGHAASPVSPPRQAAHHDRVSDDEQRRPGDDCPS